MTRIHSSSLFGSTRATAAALGLLLFAIGSTPAAAQSNDGSDTAEPATTTRDGLLEFAMSLYLEADTLQADAYQAGDDVLHEAARAGFAAAATALADFLEQFPEDDEA